MKILLLCTLVFFISACQTIAPIKQKLAMRDNGSLDYKNIQKLPPIYLPVAQNTQAFTPIYDVPDIDDSKVASFTNAQNKQYELPAPPKVVN